MLDTDNYPTPNKGASVQTWGLSKELAKRGHDVFIVRRSGVKGKEIVDGVNLVCVEFNGRATDTIGFLSHLTRMSSSLYFSIKSIESIYRIRPDVMCMINRVSGVFTCRLKIPKVYVMHSPEALDFFKAHAISANGLNSVLFYIKKYVENLVIEKSERVIVLNSYIENYLKKKGCTYVTRIPNGVDIEEFSNKGDEHFILYAGRFDWNKNICELVNAYAEIHTSYPECNLYLVGAGPEERKIRLLVKEKNLQSNVKIFPWSPRKELLGEMMSKCSVFVLPSFFEAANPVVILEAMASSKPVIARTNMGTMDIILHGKNGYLYNNEQELRRYLELLLSDNNLREKIGRNARKTVEEKYTFARIADKYEELFHRLARARINIGTIDVIKHGHNGCLYGDEELKEYLEMLIGNPNLRKRMGYNARKTVEENYTFAKVASAYERLFSTVREV
jgi:glycosyltransferase involved in cell wall biosynthesis